jgi:hypothetical protein
MEMPFRRWRRTCLCAAITSMLAPAVGATDVFTADRDPLPVAFTWATVANSASVMPGGDGVRTFNSFNQPSVNGDGLVVIRGRSKGGDASSGAGQGGQPLRGIYSRKMGGKASPLVTVFDTTTVVPEPNNTLYQDKPGTFTEFPAFPRIGLDNATMVSRAQSKPVFEYQVGTDPITGSPITTRTGTSGVYAMARGTRFTAMSQLGAVPGFDYFSVPGAAPGTKFDQFPGAPAVANSNSVVFKGNYTDGLISKTGIFFRAFGASTKQAKTQVIASSDTVIPGQPVGGVRFGSTAPPSASEEDVVFLGLDNEDNPTLGGIYRAPLATKPRLRTLVSIGDRVPGEHAGTNFTRLGEALSYDGKTVAFWGAWGSEVRLVTLPCAGDGQAAVIAFCNKTYPNGFTVSVPVHQGFFVHDVKEGRTYPVVKTGGEFSDFMYWTFSGRPPGVGDSDSEDFEDPRWRSAAFAAVYTRNGKAMVAFKARRPTLTDGIYLTSTPSSPAIYRTVVETTSGATLIDPAAPAGTFVTSVGIERDGLRNGWLAVVASMLNPLTSESWAGVYLTRTERQK